MKKILIVSIITLFAQLNLSAQDVSIPLAAAKKGWGWGCDITYNVANPNTTAGIGCSSATVTQIDFNAGWWAGSFGILDTTDIFSWSDIDSLKEYTSIDLLIYPEIACNFNDTISYKGWNGTANVSSSIPAIETKTLVPNEWQIVTIDLTVPLVDDVDDQIIYSSINADTTFILNNVQIKYLSLSAATGIIYIGGITLKEPTAEKIKENSIECTTFPNPVTNELHVKTTATIKQVEIYNSLGNVVLTAENSSTIQVGELSSGVYAIKVTTENNSILTQTFIKQ